MSRVGLAERSSQESALAQLTREGVEYALLRAPVEWADSGDVDILVRDFHGVEEVLLAMGYIRFSGHEHGGQYLRFDRQRGEWVHLDVQSGLGFGSVVVPAAFLEELVGSAQPDPVGVFRLRPTDETILSFFHAVSAKGRLDPKYRERWLSAGTPELGAAEGRYSFLPHPLGDYLLLLAALQAGELDEREVVKRTQAMLGVSAPNRPRVFARVARKFRALVGRRGIVFLGPDGAGKSTLTEALQGLRWPAVRRQFMGPARESEMRWIFRIWKRPLESLRERHSKGSPVGILARALWHGVCYFDFLERLLRHRWFMGRDGVVFFDRYACDVYFRKPERWSELMFLRFFPRPRYVYLCVGDPRTIHERKQELTPSEIGSTIDLYRQKLTEYRISHFEVDTTRRPPGEVVPEVVRHLIENNWFR